MGPMVGSIVGAIGASVCGERKRSDHTRISKSREVTSTEQQTPENKLTGSSVGSFEGSFVGSRVGSKV